MKPSIWSTRYRQAVIDVYGKCCPGPAEQPFYSPTLQERAWTSPIRVNPHTNTKEST
ncbi:MAG: hypothetical protein OSA45_15535 [Halioglobus sp.]|nr:hypothetical protein [Halioglobus sp.]